MSVETTGQGQYTHKQWKHQVGTVLLTVAGIIQDLILMDTVLGSDQVQGGKEQRDLVQGLIVAGGAVLQAGIRFVDETDDRLLLLAQVIQQVGLVNVAKKKQYHQV